MNTIQSVESNIDFDEIVSVELSKILMHPLFLSSGILSGFLKFIVNEALAGRQDQIKEYTIALHVFKKPPSFVPAQNGVVRVHAKRLRDALLIYYDQKGSGHDCMISIPKGRYIPVFEKNDNKQPSKKTDTQSFYNKSETINNRIAFMPLKTYDYNISQSSFVDSLGEEMTRQFSNRSDLSILSCHAMRMLSPKEREIKNLVSSYHVQYLISGSCRFEHSKIKVFVELIDAESESQVWSGIYYQRAAAANYFKAVDHIASEVMSDLSKIKCLECDNDGQITNILYLDNYNKNPKPARRLAGN
jgi:adenylate cyclase